MSDQDVGALLGALAVGIQLEPGELAAVQETVDADNGAAIADMLRSGDNIGAALSPALHPQIARAFRSGAYESMSGSSQHQRVGGHLAAATLANPDTGVAVDDAQVVATLGPVPRRRAIAGTTDNAAMLRWFAGDAAPAVRHAVARNPSTPGEVLINLHARLDPPSDAASDQAPLGDGTGSGARFMRMALAENPATPVDVLRLLATDPAAAVRIRAEHNPTLSA